MKHSKPIEDPKGYRYMTAQHSAQSSRKTIMWTHTNAT